MLSKVMHHRGQRSGRGDRIPKVVNNFAAAYSGTGEQLATAETRLFEPCPTRADRRLPTPPPAPGPSAKRTSPLEGSHIRSRPSQVPAPLRAARIMNPNWNEQPYFAALDWAKDHHDVIVVDRVGTIVADFQFAHTAPGWEEFNCKMQPFGKCPLTIETSVGMAVDQLLERGYPLYPINPLAANNPSPASRTLCGISVSIPSPSAATAARKAGIVPGSDTHTARAVTIRKSCSTGEISRGATRTGAP